MSYDVPGDTRSYEAAGNLVTSQFKFVKLAGANVTAVSAITDKAIGVLQNKPDAAGKAATVMIDGVSRVRASGAIAAGVAIYMAADGSATSTQGASALAVGVSENAVAGAGELVSVLLKPLGAVI